MSKIWEKNRDLIVLGILGILAFIVVLILLYPEKEKIIQSGLIVILVFTTLYYAIQTRKLVEREKITFEDQKNKRNADYGEKKLHDFYFPLNFNLQELNRIIGSENDVQAQIMKLYLKIAELGLNYGYGISKRLEDKILALINILWEIKSITKDQTEILEKWKQRVKTKAAEVSYEIKNESTLIEDEIKKVYRLFEWEKADLIKK